MIKFTNVFKTYAKGGLALKDVSFHIGKGEFAFLTGHSGAGKSTVLKLVYADEPPTSGEVRVSGYDVTGMRANEVPHLRRRLGIVFQDFRLLEDRTAEENVAFALEVTGTPRRKIRPAVDRHCRAVLLIGRDAPLIERALAGSPARVAMCGTLDRAVADALSIAQPGDAVLLSPACASLDQFRDYVERGERFGALVRQRTAGATHA